jgi:hypothetical protein
MALVTSGVVVAAAGVANAAYQGKKGRDAARDAANLQAGAAENAAQMTQEAQQQLRSDLSPYRQAGETALPLLQQMATSSGADQVAQLQSNPLFQATVGARDRASLGLAATQGRIGTGDTSAQFDENFLLSASPLLQQQEQRLLNLAGIGQSSASQAGVSGLQAAGAAGGNLMGAADARSAGIIGAQQATANQNAQILQNLPTLINSFGNLGGQGVAQQQKFGMNYAPSSTRIA